MNGNLREAPFIVGIGGTTRAHSSSERVVRAVLAATEAAGATTEHFGADRIELPMYAPERPGRTGRRAAAGTTAAGFVLRRTRSA